MLLIKLGAFLCLVKASHHQVNKSWNNMNKPRIYQNVESPLENSFHCMMGCETVPWPLQMQWRYHRLASTPLPAQQRFHNLALRHFDSLNNSIQDHGIFIVNALNISQSCVLSAFLQDCWHYSLVLSPLTTTQPLPTVQSYLHSVINN